MGIAKNPYFHNSQDLQCSATQPHRTRNWENSLEELKWFSEKLIHNITNSDNPLNFRMSSCKKLHVDTVICWFLQGIWLHTKREDGANTSSLWSPQRNCHSHKNTQIKVHSPDEDIDYYDIVSGVLHEDTLNPYLFIIYLDYVLRTLTDLMKENGFTLDKVRSRRYPAQTIADADYADDIALLANTPYQCRIPAALSGAGSRWHWSPCKYRQNGMHVS